MAIIPVMAHGVIAVIVTWNARDDALRGVAACLGQRGAAVERILVIDNASTDDTRQALLALKEPRLEVITLPANTGGAGGFARGMAEAVALGADWVWLIDGDATPRPHALRELLHVANRWPRLGAVGSCIVRKGSDIVQECGCRLHRITGKPIFLKARECVSPDWQPEPADYLAACSLLARGTAIHEIGTFDSDLFIFYDDIDWCLRLRRAGWRLATAPRSLVDHPFHGAKPIAPWRLYFGARNQILVLARHANGWPALLRTWIWAAWARRWQSRWLHGGHRSHAEALARALADARIPPVPFPSLPQAKAQPLAAAARPGAISLLISLIATVEIAVAVCRRSHRPHPAPGFRGRQRSTNRKRKPHTMGARRS